LFKVHDGARLFLSLKPGINRTNTSSLSSLMGSQTNSSGLTNGVTSCYSTNNCIKTSEADHRWQMLQGSGNQIYLFIYFF